MINYTSSYLVINHDWNGFSTYISFALLVIVDAGAILLNLLVILIIFRDSLLRDKADCILISNLALSDLLVAIVIIPFSIQTLIYKELRFPSAISFMIGFANFFFCITSIMTLMFLVLDQTCTIKWPLRYERYRTRRLAIIASFYSWLHSAACALPPAFGLASYKCFIANTGPCSDYDWAGTNGSVIFTIAVTTASWGIALIVTFFCYAQILTIVIKQQRRLAKQEPTELKSRRPFDAYKGEPFNRKTNRKITKPVTTHAFTNEMSLMSKLEAAESHSNSTAAKVRISRAVTTFTTQILAIQAHQKHLIEMSSSHQSCNSNSLDSQRQNHRAVKHSIWKPAKTLLLIICVYFFTWSPFCILLLIEVAMKKKITSGMSLIFLWIGHTSSLLNPIMYFLRYRKFRVLAIKLYRDIRQWLDHIIS